MNNKERKIIVENNSMSPDVVNYIIYEKGWRCHNFMFLMKKSL